MIPRAIPWSWPLIGWVALALNRDPLLLGQSLLILIPPLLVRKWFLKRVSAFVLPLLSLGLIVFNKFVLVDRMALIVTVLLSVYMTRLELRLFALGSGLFILAGNRGTSPEYVFPVLAFTLTLVSWLYQRQQNLDIRLSLKSRVAPSRAREAVLTLGLAAGLGFVTARSLPIFEGLLIESYLHRSLGRTTGFGLVTDLRGVSSLSESNAVALRVFSRYPRYLRGQVYSRYVDGRWMGAKQKGWSSLPPDDDGPRLPRERIESELIGEEILFVPLNPEHVQAPGCLIRKNQQGIHVVRKGDLREYSYVPTRVNKSAREGDPPPEYLELPSEMEIEKKIRPMAAQWVRPAKSPMEKAQIIEAKLSSDFKYTLEPGAPDSRDPIERFLFDTRAGHCEYFATSMVLMLRTLGIPARYVTGYSVSEKSPFGDYMVARDSSAHAWVESWFPDRGWVTYDPTPPGWQSRNQLSMDRWFASLGDYFWYLWEKSSELLRSFVANSLEGVSGHFRDVLERLFSLKVILVIVVLFVMVLARRLNVRLLKNLRFGMVKNPSMDDPFLGPRKALVSMEESLHLRGLRRGLTQTPREFLREIRGSPLPVSVKEASLRLIELFCRTRYRGDPWQEGQAQTCLEIIADTKPR